MSGVGHPKYHVVSFLDKRYKGPADYVCVPRSWVQSRDDEDDPLVNVWYPDEDAKYTERRVRKRKQKSDHWEFYLALVIFSTNSYEDAKSYIQKELNQETNKGDYNDYAEKCFQVRLNKLERKNGDHTKSSEKVEEKNAKIDNVYLVVKMLDALGWCVSSKSTNTMTIKRKVLQEPDKEVHNKHSRVTESELIDEFDDAVAGPSTQVFKSRKENLTFNHEVSNEDQCTKETPIKNSNHRNGLENRQTVNQNNSDHSLDPEIFAQLTQSPIFSKFCGSMSELQNVLGNAMLKELLNYLLNTRAKNNCSIASAPRDMTAEAAKSNEEKNNENQPEVNVTDDDDYATIKKNSSLKRTKEREIDLEDQNISTEIVLDDSEEENVHDDDYEPVNKRSSPRKAKKVILPPDYDPNDTTWTLRYREPKPELVELIKDTGVYVPAITLTRFQRIAREGTSFARMLLKEIFTESALSTCSWTGTRARAYDPNGTNTRPELDKLARTVLLNYVTEYAAEEGWPNSERKTILSSLRNKMQKMRP